MADDLLLTAAQMRSWEGAAIASGAVTGLELMERAGVGAVDAILAEWPALAAVPGRAIVLCGPGNNGGDGFVVARLLAGRGWAVETFLLGDAARLPPDARANHDRWAERGKVRSCDDAALRALGNAPPDLVVDAIFGTGLTRGFDVPPAVDVLFRRAMDGGSPPPGTVGPPRVVALEVPSGLDADSGRWLRGARGIPDISAHLTIAFQTGKPGHVLQDGPAACTALRVVDLGLERLAPLSRAVPADEAGRILEQVPRPGREPSGSLSVARKGTGGGRSRHHKYDHGHALVLAGGFGRTGAARLSARAALRVGAGLVTVAAPGAAMMECACQLTAIMLRRCDDADALAALLEDARLNALCLGPGLGIDVRAAGLVATALASGRACVLDADALTLIARDDALRAALHPGCVLTPHAGEFTRLCPDIAARLDAPAETGPAYSKVDAARDAAAAAGCTILLKGPDTVIADPDGRASVNAAVYARAAPWLATAGTGDVLAGMVAGLLARGLAPHDTAATAAWLHVEAARDVGPGLIAEDLPERIPAVLAALARD